MTTASPRRGAAERVRTRAPSSDALHAERAVELREREDGTVPTDEEPTHLAVTAQPDAALHVAFDGQPDAIRCDAAVDERCADDLHHPFRPADERDRRPPVPCRVVEEGRDQPDPTLPRPIATVDRLGEARRLVGAERVVEEQ